MRKADRPEPVGRRARPEHGEVGELLEMRAGLDADIDPDDDCYAVYINHTIYSQQEVHLDSNAYD